MIPLAGKPAPRYFQQRFAKTLDLRTLESGRLHFLQMLDVIELSALAASMSME